MNEAITDSSPILHIHAPQPSKRALHATTCHDCKKRTRLISFFTDWYGWSMTCMRCGRQWQGGEWMPLDFYRGVRQKNIERAKKRWREWREPEPGEDL